MALDKKVAQILEKYQKAKRHRQRKDPKWKELDAFDRGEQWELGDTQLPPWVPKPVTNFIHLVKTTKRAALAIENPGAMIMGQSPQDHENAKELQKIVDFVWKQMKARSVVRDVLETSKLLGTGIAMVYFDYENGTVKGADGGRYQGEIKMRQIDPANFYPDPNAFRLEDCEYIHLVFRRPIKWVEKQFGVKGLKPTNRSHQEMGEIYNRDYNSESKENIIDLHYHYEKVPDNEVGGFKYQLTVLAGDRIVRETQQLKPNRYPFAILYDYKQRQDFWGQGICELILDNQKLINKVESIMALIGVLLQNPQKVVYKRSGINPEEATMYGSAPGHVWESDVPAEQAMFWMPTPQIPSALFNLAEQARFNIREITGMTEAYMGQTVGSLQTSTGVNSLIERSTMRDRDQMYDFELFIEDLIDIIIHFIVEYYTETRIARITGEKGQEPEFLEFIGSDFKDVKYDIQVDISAMAPVTKVRKQEELDKILNIQGQYQFEPAVITPQEYISESNFIDSERIIERMNMEEIRSAEAIMTEVLQMATEAQQQGLPPEEVAAMAQAMLVQRFEEKQGGIGSAAEHSGEMQMRQGVPQGI